jgi:tRNA (adenine37-N6)-methyltransferase
VVDKKFAAGLDGIDGYSHIFVITWLHLVTDEMREVLKGHTPMHRETEGFGVFAVRSRNRPNPLGLAVVELLGRDGNVLKVKGLDAVSGTPVVDLKPYDYIDRKEEISVPDWWLRAHRSSDPRRAGTKRRRSKSGSTSPGIP